MLFRFRSITGTFHVSPEFFHRIRVLSDAVVKHAVLIECPLALGCDKHWPSAFFPGSGRYMFSNNPEMSCLDRYVWNEAVPSFLILFLIRVYKYSVSVGQTCLHPNKNRYAAAGCSRRFARRFQGGRQHHASACTCDDLSH